MEKRKKRKKKIRFLRIIIIIIFLVICYFLFNLVTGIKTKNIIILNNSYYNDEEIISAAKIEDYPKFVFLSKKKIRNNLKSLDLIEGVNIKKDYLKAAITLDIKEKKILYLKRSTDKYVLSDGSSISLDNVISKPVLINYVEEETEKKFIEAMSLLKDETISKISEIEYSKTEFDSERFLLFMNDGNEVYVNITRLENLDKYTSIVTKLNGKKGILYLDSGNYFQIKEK